MRESDMTGPVAKAWRVPKPPDAPPDQEATVAVYLIEGPFHVAWQHWLMSVVHLRDIPGVKPAVKRYAEAAYEFLIASLSPDGGHNPDDPKGWRWLQPLDVCEQFHGMTDAQADEMLQAFVRGVCHGQASPDQDFRRFWRHQLDLAVQHAAGEHRGGDGWLRPTGGDCSAKLRSPPSNLR